MDKDTLMKKYRRGEIGPEEQQLLESYIEQGIIQLEELEDIDSMHQEISSIEVNVPSEQMRKRFISMLSAEKSKAKAFNPWNRLWNVLSIEMPGGQYYRIAFTISILFIGLLLGWTLSPANKYQGQLTELNSEVLQMKELIMLSMLEEPSATERLRAVSMSSEIPASYGKVLEALFKTLNNDDNVNVRLAALEVLSGYVMDAEVRKELIKSIGNQSSPLIQMEMAELMVALQEKQSVDELNKLIEKESTDPSIREQLKKSISQII